MPLANLLKLGCAEFDSTCMQKGGGGISKVSPSHGQLLASSDLEQLCAMPVHKA